METREIFTKDVIFALFGMGFDKIDYALLTATIHKLIENSSAPCRHSIGPDPFDHVFRTYVNYDHEHFHFRSNVFELKPEYNLQSEISQGITLQDYFSSQSKDMIEQIQQIDFREIIMTKIGMLGTDDLDNFPESFCELEKQRISEMFGIEQKKLELGKTLTKKK